MEIINDLWGLFVCAAFVIGFVVGSKVTEKEERRLFDRYKCFNACKFRNDPKFVLPIKIDRVTLDVTNLKKDMTKGGLVEPLFPWAYERTNKENNRRTDT